MDLKSAVELVKTDGFGTLALQSGIEPGKMQRLVPAFAGLALYIQP